MLKLNWQSRGFLYPLALCAGLVTFFIVTAPIEQMWYREDDLGQIMGGIIRSREDLVTVLTKDERAFIVPVNYVRSKPNVISGFLRPLKNFFFTVIYYLFGLEPEPFYLFHAFLHGCNVALLTILLGLYIAPLYACLGGLLFGLYPDVSWLTWIAAVHNSLVILFMLLSLLMLHRAHWVRAVSKRAYQAWFFGSGLMFLLSLAARENSIFFQLWIFGIFFFLSGQQGLWGRAKEALARSWVFFAASALYVIWKLIAFGVDTLDRTLGTVVLKFPFLRPVVQLLTGRSDALAQGATQFGSKAGAIAATNPHAAVVSVPSKLFTWLAHIEVLDPSSSVMRGVMLVIAGIFLTMLGVAFWRRKNLLAALTLGAVLMSWQGVMAYPCARYLHTMYPVLAAIIVVGLWLMRQQRKSAFRQGLFATCLVLCFAAIGRGGWNNWRSLKGAGNATAGFKRLYEPFFAKHSFPEGSKFILLSSPFVSDIHHIFQYFLKDFSAQVAFELFTTVATPGNFGCDLPVSAHSAALRITPVEGGFRFTSDDKQHAGWWIRFSGWPVVWHEGDRGYRLTLEPYVAGRWYPCSMGQLYFYEIDGDFVTDFEFKLDKRWLESGTIFVAWDGVQGTYELLDASHLTH